MHDLVARGDGRNPYVFEEIAVPDLRQLLWTRASVRLMRFVNVPQRAAPTGRPPMHVDSRLRMSRTVVAQCDGRVYAARSCSCRVLGCSTAWRRSHPAPGTATRQCGGGADARLDQCASVGGSTSARAPRRAAFDYVPGQPRLGRHRGGGRGNGLPEQNGGCAHSWAPGGAGRRRPW
jgi:hypothetical protein